MKYKIEEGLIKGAKEAVSLNKTELKDKAKYICKINGNKIGTGFFCKIKYKNELLPVLITNYHIIDHKFFENKNNLKFYVNEEYKIININKKNIIYSSENNKYDIIIIRLGDNIINNFLEIDENIFKYKSELSYKEEQIYILHHPNAGEAKVSYGKGFDEINVYDMKHLCCTEPGSSGAPILSVMTNKIIGIHKAANSKKNYNIGTFLKFPLNELKRQNENLSKIKIIKNNIFDKKLVMEKPNDNKKINIKNKVKLENKNEYLKRTFKNQDKILNAPNNLIKLGAENKYNKINRKFRLKIKDDSLNNKKMINEYHNGKEKESNEIIFNYFKMNKNSIHFDYMKNTKIKHFPDNTIKKVFIDNNHIYNNKNLDTKLLGIKKKENQTIKIRPIKSGEFDKKLNNLNSKLNILILAVIHVIQHRFLQKLDKYSALINLCNNKIIPGVICLQNYILKKCFEKIKSEFKENYQGSYFNSYFCVGKDKANSYIYESFDSCDSMTIYPNSVDNDCLHNLKFIQLLIEETKMSLEDSSLENEESEKKHKIK